MRVSLKIPMICGSCQRSLYVDQVQDFEANTTDHVLKCVNDTCQEFNKQYELPTFDLIPYNKEKHNVKASQPTKG